MKLVINGLRCGTRMWLTLLVNGFACRVNRQVAKVLACLVGFYAACLTANGAIEVLGVQYQQDQLYPEYKCIWHYDCHADVPGGNVHVYVKNTGASSVVITNVTLAGYFLKTVLRQDTTVHEARSIFYYWDDPPAAIMNAGDPAWYKSDPSTAIPPGGVAQAVVRLRSVPTTPTVSVGVFSTGGTVTTNIPIDANAPQLASVGFSTNRSKVYLHWRRSDGAVPTKIKIDGNDVTASTTTVGDPTVNFGASVVTLGTPLTYMSYHVFQGVYADGKTATASLRAWSHPFLYASWGTFPGADQSVGEAQAWIDQATQHGFNAAQNQGIGGSLGSYLSTSAGKAYADARGGYGVIAWTTSQSNDPLMSFLDDEPDAEESNLSCGTGLNLPCGKSPMGVVAMREIAKGDTTYRALFPLSPTTVNMDGAFRPVNYITWGQVADVLQVDPYYQKRLVDAYWWDATQIPLFRKATYIYAVTKATVTGAEPNPAHPILYSCEWRDDVNGVTKTWPFPTTESKRIEVYYSLAAGAKGISYWWFTPCGGLCSNGLGDQSKPAAQALWKELGLLGNEIKTVGPLLVTSHPVDMTLTPSTNVWARALASGTDTIILTVVNDDYYNDEAGFHSTDVNNATLTATLPSWLQSPTAFEITFGGIRPVSTQLNGNQLQVDLGTLKLTRMIVLTRDVQLLPTIQQRYDEQVRPGICVIAGCTNVPFSITQQPTDQIAATSDPARFTVVAFGTDLRYQWQTNSVDLVNGGRYSGCTNATLTISNCGPSDATSYRCVVTSATGNTNSSNATLTVSTDPPAAPTANPAISITIASFLANWSNAGGATGYRLDVSTNNAFVNYVSGYQDLDVGNVSSRSVIGLSAGTKHYYRVRAYNGNGTGGDSGTISVTTAVSPPSPPTAIAATSVSISGFTANWNSAGAATGYQLDVSITNSFSSYVSGHQNLDVGNALNSSVSGLSAGRTYYYRVRAYNSGGTSGNSSTISATTLPAAPTANAATSLVSSGFTANWSSVVGATGYRLDLSTNGAFANYVSGYQDLDVGNALSRGVIESNAGATYYYRVRAYNVSGAGGNSGSITVTLPVSTAYACIVISNANFESGFSVAGGGIIGTNWTEWEGYPGVTTGYDENAIVHGGGHSQRIRVGLTGYTNATTGGVYQRVPTTTGLPYSVSVWTYAGDALSPCYLGVDPAGGTNANSGVTWSSANNTQSWVTKTWAGVATSNYLTVFYKVATPDTVKRNGYFDDAGQALVSPQLLAQANGSGLTLTWPECPNARLEQSGSLAQPVGWTTVTNVISTVNGQKSVTILPTESVGFFRLALE